MAELVFSQGFIEDTDAVELDSKLAQIMDVIALLETSPCLGSANLPDSIVEQYGASVRKLVIDPFDVIYEFLSHEDVVLIHGLVHQKAAR